MISWYQFFSLFKWFEKSRHSYLSKRLLVLVTESKTRYRFGKNGSGHNDIFLNKFSINVNSRNRSVSIITFFPSTNIQKENDFRWSFFSLIFFLSHFQEFRENNIYLPTGGPIGPCGRWKLLKIINLSNQNLINFSTLSRHELTIVPCYRLFFLSNWFERSKQTFIQWKVFCLL